MRDEISHLCYEMFLFLNLVLHSLRHTIPILNFPCLLQVDARVVLMSSSFFL